MREPVAVPLLGRASRPVSAIRLDDSYRRDGHFREKLSYLEQYGAQPISYSLFQEGLKHHFVRPLGFVGYAECLGKKFVLGNPVCDLADAPAFLKTALKDLQEPAFVQIDRPMAALLHDRFQYRISPMGVETNIAIQAYQLENDTKKRNLRSFVRKGREQSRVHELTSGELHSRFHITRSDLEQLSSRWMATKVSKVALKFLVRNTVYEDEPYVRKFYSIAPDGHLLGFVFFNPIFSRGKVMGYCADIMRSAPTASKGHVAYMVISAMEKFKEEGIELLSLGLSPCANISASGFRGDWVTQSVLRTLFRFGNSLYNFRGLYENKRQYAGAESQVYFATRSVFPAFQLFSITRYIGLF